MRAVVTGGGGFLGRRIVELLLQEGAQVTSVSRREYAALEAMGVECLLADLGDRDAISRALQGAEVVFHVAAKAGVWGARREYMQTNLEGTRNIIEACQRHGVGKLIYTSSPSVCFDGRDQRRVAGDLPLARSFLAAYPESKARAEALVRAADGPQLSTVALRPHLIFGPRDPHLIPRLLQRAATGRLAMVGQGDNEVSLTHVDNAAWAHLCAARALGPGTACAGRGYFVANGEPVRLWAWVNALLEGLDRPRVQRRIPLGLARVGGGLCELLWRVARLRGEPPMTRFVALQLGRSHSYDMTRTCRDLGYRERIGMAEASERLVQELRGVAPVSAP